MTSHPDDLATWLRVRMAVRWQDARPVALPAGRVPPPVRDGASHDIRTWDHARDPGRAEQMLAALRKARADVSTGVALTFELLCSWQRLVLDSQSVEFRTRPAFAKDGRERYGIHADTRERFDACLRESAEETPALAARAARVYLDVCFFHPFDNGNARSAFLALTFVLARAGIVLDHVAPLRRIARYADDPEGALAFADLVAVLINHSLRRAVANQHG